MDGVDQDIDWLVGLVRKPARAEVARFLFCHALPSFVERNLPVETEWTRSDRDLFEEWLVERWLRDIRSEEFRDSVQYQRLRAEWERSNGY